MPSRVPCPERDDIKLLPSNCSKRMSTYVTVMVSQCIPFFQTMWSNMYTVVIGVANDGYSV